MRRKCVGDIKAETTEPRAHSNAYKMRRKCVGAIKWVENALKMHGKYIGARKCVENMSGAVKCTENA